MAKGNETKEEVGAPHAGPHEAKPDGNEGEAGETYTGATGLRSGPGPGAAPGLAGMGEDLMPPVDEETESKEGTVTMTEHEVKINKKLLESEKEGKGSED